MTASQIKQHLTVKNIFIAIVALNIFSAVSTSRIGGTFEHTSKAPVSTEIGGPKAPVADPGLIAHMMPGEHLPAQAEPSSEPKQPAWKKVAPPPSKTVSKPKTSDSPTVRWPMLLALCAMALFARYLAIKMAQTAVVNAIDSVKQIAGALNKLGSRAGAPAKPVQSARLPLAQPPPRNVKGASPRKSTVVRASRWPFAA
jgi:hypothetical protein